MQRAHQDWVVWLVLPVVGGPNSSLLREDAVETSSAPVDGTSTNETLPPILENGGILLEVKSSAFDEASVLLGNELLQELQREC